MVLGLGGGRFRTLAGGVGKWERSACIARWTSVNGRETTSELPGDHLGTSTGSQRIFGGPPRTSARECPHRLQQGDLPGSLLACSQYRRDFAIKSGAASAQINGSGTPVTIPCCDRSLRSQPIRGVSFFAWS